MNKTKPKDGALLKDSLIIVTSIIVAVFLVKTRIIENSLISFRELTYLSSFIAGIFFTSVFTTAPSTVALVELAQIGHPLAVAIIGGAGAALGDLIIFRLVRDQFTERITAYLMAAPGKRLKAIFRLKIFQWLIPMLGALVIASPLPDEIGLFMLGLTSIRTRTLLALSFLLNSAGIYFIITLVELAV